MKSLKCLLLSIFIIGITGYSIDTLLIDGILAWHIRQPETLYMILELACLWICLFLIGIRVKKNSIKLLLSLGLFLGFSYIHMTFLPVLITIIYLIYLVWLGEFTYELLQIKESRISRNFFLGSGITIVLFCFLSLFQMGQITNTRYLVVALGSGLLIRKIVKKKIPIVTMVSDKKTCAYFSTFIVALALGIGRLNIAIDFDTLWYGVRSDAILIPGKSIYENIGTLGVVYSYSKGWEVLTLPLSNLPSYSFLTAFNIGVLGMIFIAVYEIANEYIGKNYRYITPFLIVAVPGIMNMALTTKSDLLTLFYQILMIHEILGFFKEKQGSRILTALGALFLSFTMKPTSLVYSTVIGIIALCILGINWNHQYKVIEKPQKGEYVVLGISILALVGIWGRTVALVGVPVTSVFHSIFERLNFQIKYPYYTTPFPNAGTEQSFREHITFLGKRIFGILLDPQGKDMAHVIIAWGGILPICLLGILLFFVKFKIKRNPFNQFLFAINMAVLLINGISLLQLSQIDGNYYVLWYFILIFTMMYVISKYGREQQRWVKRMLLLPWCFGFLLCFITNWSWSIGFSPIDVVNRGYYDHHSREKQKRIHQGSEAIWNILAENPNNRVIALGEHPGVLAFPCIVQSYVDISGYWGNPEVVSNKEAFLAYLKYAEIDYIYMEKEYIDESVRIYKIIRKLIKDGALFDVRDEHGNLIMAVQKEMPDLNAVEQNLDVFDHRYIQHP